MIFAPDSRLVQHVHPATNVEARRGVDKPDLLILHYTGMSSTAKAIDWLCRAESGVSCHYVVAEDGVITQLVPEAFRAWHAGQSFWRGVTDINSASIGIEIQNPGHEDGYPEFPEAQMRSVVALAQDIAHRHGIAPEAVLAHSDVAPERKIDPGEKFDWHRLAKAGVGRIVRASPINDADAGLELGSDDPRIARVQMLLSSYGYDSPISGVLDDKTSKVLRAFQLHFRPKRVDGRLDRSTERTLQRLIDTVGSPPVA